MIYILYGGVCLTFFIFGLLFHKVLGHADGRLVIIEETDEYFVAIRTPTDKLKKKHHITLTVTYSTKRGGA